MAKSVINEKHSLAFEGDLVIQDDVCTMDFTNDGMDKKKLSDMLAKFNGERIKVSVVKATEITE